MESKPSRQKIASGVMEELLPSFSFDRNSSILFVEEYTGVLQKFPNKKNISHDMWNRCYSSVAHATTWSKNNNYSHVVIRLPKSHEAFDMILHAAFFAAREHAEIITYGMNDEGIKGAQKKLQEFFGNYDVVGFKRGCRVLRSVKDSDSADSTSEKFLKKSLEDFKKEVAVRYHDINHALVSYPGVFNDGQLDEGTKLLLDASLHLTKGSENILDFGCGTGIIAGILKEQLPTISLDLLDNDILALEAVKENLSSIAANKKSFILGDSLVHCKGQKYNLILSNPPMHSEKDEQTTVIEQLITDAPHYLKKDGQLVIVTQSRLALGKNFTKTFSSHDILAQNTKYTVWCGQG